MRRILAAPFAAACVLAAACTGEIGRPNGAPSDMGSGPGAGTGGSGGSGSTGSGGSGSKVWVPPVCKMEEKAFAPARVWQLTDQEYVSVVAAALGVTLTGPDAEVTTAASNSGVFSNMSEENSVTIASAQLYQTAAVKVASQASTDAKMQSLLGLATATTMPTTAQVQSFITTKIARLWRRPVARDEGAALVTLDIGSKASYWLGTEALPMKIKNSAMFPEYTASVKAALYTSVKSFIADVVWKGHLDDLFTSQKVFANAELGTLYGLPGASGTALSPVTVTAPERSAGILTQPGMLATANKWDGPG